MAGNDLAPVPKAMCCTGRLLSHMQSIWLCISNNLYAQRCYLYCKPHAAALDHCRLQHSLSQSMHE